MALATPVDCCRQQQWLYSLHPIMHLQVSPPTALSGRFLRASGLINYSAAVRCLRVSVCCAETHLQADRIQGSLGYCAPEIATAGGEGEVQQGVFRRDGQLSACVDIWACKPLASLMLHHGGAGLQKEFRSTCSRSTAERLLRCVVVCCD
jgi:hypothetical protein